jgi:hypothetical protein
VRHCPTARASLRGLSSRAHFAAAAFWGERVGEAVAAIEGLFFGDADTH